MTAPATLNFGAYQGATFTEALTWSASGAPVDLTGATAAMTVKSGSAVLVTLTSADGSIALGGTAGTITLLIPGVATAALPPCNAEYDLLVKMADGAVRALVAGAFTVRKGTTLAV